MQVLYELIMSSVLTVSCTTTRLIYQYWKNKRVSVPSFFGWQIAASHPKDKCIVVYLKVNILMYSSDLGCVILPVLKR